MDFLHTFQLEFDANTIKAHNREITDLKNAAVLQSQSLQQIVTLHTELHEQEQVLTMYAKERDEAIAMRNQQELSLKSLQKEGTELRQSIDREQTVTIEKEQLAARTKVLEEIHDVCRSLSAWKLTKMSATRAELVYEHHNGASHIIQVQFAAKAPAIVCTLTFCNNPSSVLNVSSGYFSDLVASLNSTWSEMVQNVMSLSELQHAMQSIDVEMGRMQALDQDLTAVSKRFAIPKGIQVGVVDANGANNMDAPAATQSPSVCSFTVHFSCLEPASKWSVGFDVSRGYPFGRVNIVPETEFGSAPSNVADICDVAFGYTRLERACEYLNDLFKKSCQGKK